MTGKLAMQADSGEASGLGSLFRGVEITNMVAMSVSGDIGIKSPRALDLEYSFDPCRAVAMELGICEITHVVGCPQIDDPVVSCVAIHVVDDSRDRLAVYQQPSDAVAQEPSAIDVNTKIAVWHYGSCRGAGVSGVPPFAFPSVLEMRRWPFPPLQQAGSGVIVQDFADVIAFGQGSQSHLPRCITLVTRKQ